MAPGHRCVGNGDACKIINRIELPTCMPTCSFSTVKVLIRSYLYIYIFDNYYYVTITTVVITPFDTIGVQIDGETS